MPSRLSRTLMTLAEGCAGGHINTLRLETVLTACKVMQAAGWERASVPHEYMIAAHALELIVQYMCGGEDHGSIERIDALRGLLQDVQANPFHRLIKGFGSKAMWLKVVTLIGNFCLVGAGLTAKTVSAILKMLLLHMGPDLFYYCANTALRWAMVRDIIPSRGRGEPWFVKLVIWVVQLVSGLSKHPYFAFILNLVLAAWWGVERLVEDNAAFAQFAPCTAYHRVMLYTWEVSNMGRLLDNPGMVNWNMARMNGTEVIGELHARYKNGDTGPQTDTAAFDSFRTSTITHLHVLGKMQVCIFVWVLLLGGFGWLTVWGAGLDAWGRRQMRRCTTYLSSACVQYFYHSRFEELQVDTSETGYRSDYTLDEHLLGADLHRGRLTNAIRLVQDIATAAKDSQDGAVRRFGEQAREMADHPPEADPRAVAEHHQSMLGVLEAASSQQGVDVVQGVLRNLANKDSPNANLEAAPSQVAVVQPRRSTRRRAAPSQEEAAAPQLRRSPRRPAVAKPKNA